MYLDDKLYIDVYITANTGNDRLVWDVDRLANCDNYERLEPKKEHRKDWHSF